MAAAVILSAAVLANEDIVRGSMITHHSLHPPYLSTCAVSTRVWRWISAPSRRGNPFLCGMLMISSSTNVQQKHFLSSSLVSFFSCVTSCSLLFCLALFVGCDASCDRQNAI
ncbi:GPI-anchored surface protein, putative [Bodo saltans]|uniref:GPI-anchored surface protein, putative n=1 Tax=Bodo saltans TaxID=75058 RepID=A0A0S4J9X8_BODSA|nr:GPI-anchored surface protein, putative [Bodo saltans]|eukprot:CUG86905.1 GPI-anchored surface protein, putative [Bodo saltans]